MKQIYADLWQTEAEHPFWGVTSHAYLLRRTEGNILFYSFSQKAPFQTIEALGGVAYQYLSHRDEAGPQLATIRSRFHSKLCCHHLEEAAVSRFAPVDCLFDQRELRGGNVEVIPTPGHTNGSVCFYVQSDDDEPDFLLTGDTIYLDHGEWKVRVNRSDGGSRSDLRNSLLALRNLAPVVVLSSASVGSIGFKEVTSAEWVAVINGIADTLELSG